MQEQWIPGRKFLNDGNLSWLQMVGRLKPGVSIAQATANAAVVAGRIDQEHQPRKTTLRVSRATLMNVPEAHAILLGGGVVVLTAVSLVLLIACANLANLLMARAADRQKEIAIRLAMGARRRQIIRQLLVESLSLSVVGGVFGLLAAWGILKSLVPLAIAQLPPEVRSIALNVNPDPRIIVYLLMLSFASGVGFGLLPALQATRFDLNGALKESGTIFGRIGRHRLRNTLVAVQVAVCMILLIGAGLLTRGLQAVQTIEPGFRVTGVAVGAFDLNRQGYDAARSTAFHDELARRLAARGIQSALVSPVPLNGSRSGTGIRLEDRQESVDVFMATASSSYFQLLEIPIIQGRPFNDGEVLSAANVVVVSESTARRLWPGENAVGKRFTVGRQPGLWEVVGIAHDIHSTGLSQADDTLIYFPPRNDSRLKVAILARGGDSGVVLRSIREEAAAINANVMVRTNTLDDNLNLWQFPARITAGLGSILGIAGLLLASMGIYGVVAYAVGRRTREIGIRMSLGANRSDVIRMILVQTMRPVVVGGVIGVVGGAALSGFLRNVFFGVRLLDPIVFGGVGIFLALVALLVSYAPARRAAGVDPMVALRQL
jgi:predicted permease